MRDEKLKTSRELITHAKATWNQTFDFEAECFVDAFSNGEYHEEEFDWSSVVDKLDVDEVVSLFLPVCHGLICGCTDHRDGDSLKDLVSLYDLLATWQRKALIDPTLLIAGLAKVRVYVLKLSEEEPGWAECKPFYLLLELGVTRRMGLDTTKILAAY